MIMIARVRNLLCQLLLLSTLLIIPNPIHSLALEAEWVQLDPSQKISPRRSGHAAFGEFNQHYVFGGYTEEDSEYGMKRLVSNDLWRWHGDGNAWQPVEHSGDIPQARLVAPAATLNDKAYLFGGWDPEAQGAGGDEILDSVHELDLSTHTWRRLKTLLPDGPASRHVAVAFGQNRILIHNHRCEGFVWIFDSDSERFTKQVTTGPFPSSRGLHAACCVGGNKVVVFGGASKGQQMSNEAFVLSTDNWEWRPIAQQTDDTGTRPTPRAAPSLCAYNDNCVVVFGGAEATETGLRPRGDAWALHLEGEGRWELLLDDETASAAGGGGLRPAPRNAASLAHINRHAEIGAGKDFLLSGGWHPFVRTWDDCFVLRITET